MYICIYIHICICISMYVYTHSYVYVCACIYLHIEIWKYRCEHVQIYQLINMYINLKFYLSRH